MVCLRVSIRVSGNHARSASLASLLAKGNLVDRGVGLDGDVLAVVLVRNEVGTGCPETLVDCSRSMATPLCNIAGAEHVVVQGHALGDIRFHQELGDGRQIMRFSMKGSGVSVAL